MMKKSCNIRHLIISLIFVTSAVFPSAADEIRGRIPVEDGIYENNGHFFIIQNDTVQSEVLKSFYGFWYDGIYELGNNDEAWCLAQIEDRLYIDWWQRTDIAGNASSGGVFWVPGSNIREFALTPYPVKERISGWFIIQPDEHSSASDAAPVIYEIPYWQADVEYVDETASFKLPDGTEAFVKKHIKLGNTVYTCAAGRRPVVRNPVLKASLPGSPSFSSDSLIMVLGEPYLVKASFTDMRDAIASHNAIVYPPRFSTMDMKEPSIYKKLEDMPIAW